LTRRRRIGLAAATVLTLVLAACGTDDNTSSTTPTTAGDTPTTAFVGAADKASISGAGSTFVASIMQEWIKQYGKVAPGVTINYQGVGSGAGIQQLTAKTVDFAGSDVPLKPDEQTATGGAGAVVQIPWIGGGVAVEYNLSSVKTLKLAPATLAGIFAGSITKWDDPAIKADNGGTSLPGTGIQVVHRSDGSGTTQVFASYLKAAAPSVWTFPVDKDWHAPAGTGAKGSDGVTAAVKQADGAIGYAEVSFPKQSSLGAAQIQNSAGQFVAPTATAVTSAMAAATVNADLTLTVNYTPPAPDAYPISTTTYLMFPKSGDPAKTTALKHFALWVLTEGQKVAESVDYAPMPSSVLTQALDVVKV